MKSSETLAQLDHYLRTIWLECCGHMSKFTDDGFGSREYSNAETAARVFAPGRRFIHLYDFGTTSETGITVLGVHNGGTVEDNPITLLARNKAPVFMCQAERCHAVATTVCEECSQGENLPSGAFCDAHTRSHDCGIDLMPICNSPRTGVCGYCGPDQPPYGPGRPAALPGLLDEPSDEDNDEEDEEGAQLHPALLGAFLQAMLLPRMHARREGRDIHGRFRRRQRRTRPRREIPTTDAGWRQVDVDGMLDRYNMEQLKVFLRAKHLRVSGHKAELVARIHDYFAAQGAEAAAAGVGRA
ncbi:hypothetical protein PAPYR_7955 [Paratrimastix pyriformis]|uniref:SAP domain-containing protein n=1 Tax=Paratrimastix pyriformis TaxID=342808 RepID=A0ABQ8UH45_9EUKA|nr:hypothetical protein PAPYR_7955 [Paratrimastix pyriformis]